MRWMLTVITVALTLSLTTPTAHASDPFTKTAELINAHRAKHGVPPLSLDSEVSRTAQEWADHLQSTNRFEHRPDNVYGENLYEAGRNRAIDTVIGKALEDWYGESRRYDYDKEMTPSTVDLSVLHFTALIWKSSDRVGVGISQGRNGTYLVVNFAERGNTLNRFKANVLPPTS